LCPLDIGNLAASGFNPWRLPHVTSVAFPLKKTRQSAEVNL